MTRIVVLPVLATTGCAALGYTDRVLWRVPSPDGQLVAVCQEVPAFDGPGYDIRLERPDGSLVRGLTVGNRAQREGRIIADCALRIADCIRNCGLRIELLIGVRV